MAEAVAPVERQAARSALSLGFVAIVAWRNLWRNRRRTWLTAGGIAFAVFLVVASMSLQSGSYGTMIEGGIQYLTGHAQLQHPEYHDDPRVRHTLAEGTSLLFEMDAVSDVVAAAPRAEAFALVSSGDRSYAALVVGVDPARELDVSTLPALVKRGTYIDGPDDAILGAALARNLGVDVGGELIVLGTAREGGVAALGLTVSGIFETGQAELDRTIAMMQLRTLQEGFELGDAVHRIVLNGESSQTARSVAAAARRVVPDDIRVLTWNELVPELEQAIELDRLSANFFYWIIMILVALSVVNAFIMSIFERTREFGMLIAIGMRPTQIVGMLLVEAVCVWIVGTAVGLTLAVALVAALASTGIPLSGMEELARQYHMPDRLYPALSAQAMLTAPIVMGIGTLLAALVPTLRVRGLRPVEALRGDE